MGNTTHEGFSKPKYKMLALPAGKFDDKGFQGVAVPTTTRATEQSPRPKNLGFLLLSPSLTSTDDQKSPPLVSNVA